jgi:hypothetical protein
MRKLLTMISKKKDRIDESSFQTNIKTVQYAAKEIGNVLDSMTVVNVSSSA